MSSYFDWGTAWNVCDDCGGRYQQRNRSKHFTYDCGANSPVADKISIVEWATQYNVNRVTVWRWVRKYHLNTYKFRGNSYVSKLDYQRWLQEDGRALAGELAKGLAG